MAWVVWVVIGYVLVVLGFYKAVLYFAAGDSVKGLSVRLLYGAEFLVFGLLLLTAMARLWPGAGLAVWRMLTVSIGAALAAIGLWLINRVTRIPLREDIWMAALLGLVIGAVFVRLVPERLLRRWFSIGRDGGR